MQEFIRSHSLITILQTITKFLTWTANILLSLLRRKITWNPESVIDVEGGDVILTASASSKLPVTFNSSNDAVAYVNQIGDAWILTPVTSGTVTVTAMQHGNKNYNAAEPVVVTFLVDDEYLSVDNEKDHSNRLHRSISETVYPFCNSGRSF